MLTQRIDSALNQPMRTANAWAIDDDRCIYVPLEPQGSDRVCLPTHR